VGLEGLNLERKIKREAICLNIASLFIREFGLVYLKTKPTPKRTLFCTPLRKIGCNRPDRAKIDAVAESDVETAAERERKFVVLKRRARSWSQRTAISLHAGQRVFLER
jgi:hypothetical protein